MGGHLLLFKKCLQELVARPAADSLRAALPKLPLLADRVRAVDGPGIVYSTLIRDLEALHVDADIWLANLSKELPRLADYNTRLTRAAELVASGDHDYIASPRLDSYHNVWFELHEDLILLAGRTREDEVASGRA